MMIGCVVAAGALRTLALLRRPALLESPSCRADAAPVFASPRPRSRSRRVRPPWSAGLEEQRKAFERTAHHRARRSRERLTQLGNNGRLASTGGSRSTPPSRQPWRGSAPARTGWSGSASRPHPAHGHRRPLALLRGARPSSAGSASSCSRSRSASRSWWRPRASRGPGRHAYAAFLAAAIALLLHAAVDWDWEMPVLFVWFFGAAGVVLAAPAERAAGPPAPRRLTRLLAASRACSLAVTPVTVAVSQVRLDRSVSAFERGDCATATDAALDSLDALAVQRGGVRGAGLVRRARRAARSWPSTRCAPRAASTPATGSTPTGSRSTQALAGEDPTAAARLARRLNPLDPLARSLERGLRSRSPAAPPRGRGDGRADPARSEPVNAREAGRSPPLSEAMPGGAGSALLAGAAPQHEARAQERDAAEQDRDRGEARERAASSRSSAPASTWRAGWACRPRRRRGSSPAPLVSSGGRWCRSPRRRGRRRRRSGSRCRRTAAMLASFSPDEARDGEAGSGGAQQHAEHEHAQDDQS